jgi:hypothetical protein
MPAGAGRARRARQGRCHAGVCGGDGREGVGRARCNRHRRCRTALREGDGPPRNMRWENRHLQHYGTVGLMNCDVY